MVHGSNYVAKTMFVIVSKRFGAVRGKRLDHKSDAILQRLKDFAVPSLLSNSKTMGILAKSEYSTLNWALLIAKFNYCLAVMC